MHTRRTYTDRSQTMPFPGATDLQFRMARCFALLTNFVAALHGELALSDLAQSLIRQVEGSNLVIYRLPKADGTPRVIVDAVRRVHAERPERPTGSLARGLLERHAESATAGTIWRLGELKEDPKFAQSEAGREWLTRTDLAEVSVVVLEQTRDHIDIIEIQFERLPRRHSDLPTSMITRALADAWALRQSGRITRLISERGRSRRSRLPSGIENEHVLSSSNPCGLSRGEQRVCHLLVSGLKPVEIAKTLNVSIATTRTHLRNIYAKTGTSGQVEVLARLRDGEITALSA